MAALLDTSTIGASVESAADMAAGGRTGVVAVLFAASLFFWPPVAAIPSHAYGPARVVGLEMTEPIRHLPFDDRSELVPAFPTLALTVFTVHIGVGRMAGFVALPLMNIAAGRSRDVRSGMWGLGALSLAFFLLAPHGSR